MFTELFMLNKIYLALYNPGSSCENIRIFTYGPDELMKNRTKGFYNSNYLKASSYIAENAVAP